ncbi:MAG: AAA family ATPase, partial [Victivallales bacterium]|nr:AAA family ATPase [Victivallales bacterium]
IMGCTITQLKLVGVMPEEFIGLGDGEYCFPLNSGRPVFYLDRSIEDSYCEGMVIYAPDLENDRMIRMEYIPSGIKSSKIQLQRSQDGVLFPMLALLALRLTRLHRKKYTIEMAAEEVFNLELTSRPDFMAPIDMTVESWIPTVPQDTGMLRVKYGNDMKGNSVIGIGGLLGNYAAYWIHNADCTRLLPLSFLKSPYRDFAITIPVPQTRKIALDNLECLIFANPVVYLTEYSALCLVHNKDGFALLGIWGEKMIPRDDFSPLAGKPCVYLEILADNDTDYERAHRVALKAFARGYEQGVRNFTVQIWATGEVIPMDKLLREALEKGYLEDTDANDRNKRLDGYLDKWPKPADNGKAIVGRVIKAGRCSLLYADPGVGKTLFSQAVSTVAYQRKSLDNGCFQYTWNGSRPCRILYVQNEMDEDEFKVRQKSLDAFLNVSETKVEYHTPEDSLTDIGEQIAVLKKLETLDPEGKYQWIVWLDSVKTIMPDAEMGSTFTKKVSPFIRLLKDAGCSVVVLHHSNLQGKESGGTNINVTNNYKIHLERKSEQNGSYQVQISVEKGRDLTGNEGASAMWNWTVDAAKVISAFNSTYEDDNGASMQSAQSTQTAAPANPPAIDNTLDCLPKTWDELKALPEQEQRIALFELWNCLGSVPKAAGHLKASLSATEKRMKKLNVNEVTKQEYLAAKA